MVALLLESGSGPDSESNNGLRPLHLAAQEDHVPVAEVLVDHSAKIDPQTKVITPSGRNLYCLHGGLSFVGYGTEIMV